MQLYNADCLEILPTIPDKSIDMILCDLPYGTTRNKWDVIIPLAVTAVVSPQRSSNWGGRIVRR